MADYLNHKIRRVPTLQPADNAIRQVDFATRYDIPINLVRHLTGRGYFGEHTADDRTGITWILLTPTTQHLGRKLRDFIIDLYSRT